MRLTFIGHQSWLVEHRDTSVLIDPVLDRGFGHTAALQFRIWPPRTLDVTEMPVPHAVFLSHEHLDHFHIPSLDMLPRDVPFYTGDITPLPVVEVIERLGFTVHRTRPAQRVVVGDLEVTLYAAGPQTISWEKRVSQFVISEAGGAGDDDVFIPVDALTSREYAEDVRAGRRRPPRAAVLANNGQVVPPGALGAYTNLLPTGSPERSALSGLDLLNELVRASQIDGLPHVKEIILCGGGFVGPRSPHGPFLYSDHHWLADRANELQTDRVVYGPWPGETLVLEPGRPPVWDKVSWIRVEEDERLRGNERLERYLAAPEPQRIAPVLPRFDEDEARAALLEVRAALPALARELFHTAAGQLASSVHRFLRGPLDSRRCLLVLLDGPGGRSHQYAWDIARMDFVPQEEMPQGEALRSYPFGIKCYFRDFVAVLRGEQQIWDLAGTAMQSWYLGDSYSTLITAFYEIFGEQARPDLAAEVYARSLGAHLKSKTSAAV